MCAVTCLFVFSHYNVSNMRQLWSCPPWFAHHSLIGHGHIYHGPRTINHVTGTSDAYKNIFHNTHNRPRNGIERRIASMHLSMSIDICGWPPFPAAGKLRVFKLTALTQQLLPSCLTESRSISGGRRCRMHENRVTPPNHIRTISSIVSAYGILYHRINSYRLDSLHRFDR